VHAGCNNPFDKKTKWVVTLKKDDKNPYGSYLSFQSLKYYFPKAKVQSLSGGFRYSNIDGNMHYGDGTSLLVLLGLDFFISEAEMEQLLLFAENGNEIILFCSRLDEKLEQKLKCVKQTDGYEQTPLTRNNDGSENLYALKLAGPNSTGYGYTGRTLQNYFDLLPETKDSSIVMNPFGIKPDGADETDKEEDTLVISMPDTLGYAANHPNFIRYKVGEGHITLHAAPLALSNYFLLQGNNREYLDGVWHTLPDGIMNIYWSEYFKHSDKGSSLDVLWKYPATRWALIVAIFTLLCYVIFESKRRQRIIPVIPVTENSSVSFVETVGRLYYNKGDHANVAEKMIQHFLEWVRTTHRLNTNILNAEFAIALARKTQHTEADALKLMDMIHNVRLGSVAVNEAYLYELYNTIQSFYKNEPS
jgi:hypothetical protein